MSDTNIPKHWGKNTWEEKAKENPLFAIMTVADFADNTFDDIEGGVPQKFIEKGKRIYDRLVKANLSEAERKQKLSMFDYGCGVGRIMHAVIEDGHEALGADISKTMIDAAPRLVPTAKALCVVGENGTIDIPSESVDVAYSFAVLQHISSLKTHQGAISEMARLLKPGGMLAIQVNCEDFGLADSADVLPFTVNYEDVSVHIGSLTAAPLRVHEQNNWSGVYIGLDRMIAHLNKCGLRVDDIYCWWDKKPRSTVFIARKEAGKNCFEPRSDPIKDAGPDAYRVLLKAYTNATAARRKIQRELKAMKK